MTNNTIANEALNRATSSMSTANYSAIVSGFAAKGIPYEEIKPRENVFTFHAWKALGRVVKRGEHGVKVVTWIPVPAKLDEKTGEIVRPAGRRPKTATVFHVSQTKAFSVRETETEFSAAKAKILNDREAENEEAFERRAAFGPGVNLVNVITGKRSRT